MKYLRKRTTTIDEVLRASGYSVITIWRHEFDKNKEMKNIKLDVVEPPRIRDDGFHEGRCEPVKLIYDFKSKGIKGKYIDVVSLYPTAMYYDRYPIGHPTRISKPVKYDNDWFGFIYCEILPPRSLYLPVLPYKQKIKQATKLLFRLCKSCMSRTGAKCTHFNTTKGAIKCNDRC